MRKVVLVPVMALVLSLAVAADAGPNACQVCGWVVGEGIEFDCTFPQDGAWGYEFCEIRYLPKPGFFPYCVQTGSRCLYIEVR
jgi:hypothetical protein